MDKDMRALALLAQLHRLNGPGPDTVRITVRTATGEYLGEGALNAVNADAAIESLQAVGDHNDSGAVHPYTEGLDPLLVADLEDHFAEALLDFDSEDIPLVNEAPTADATLGHWDRAVMEMVNGPYTPGALETYAHRDNDAYLPDDGDTDGDGGDE